MYGTSCDGNSSHVWGGALLVATGTRQIYVFKERHLHSPADRAAPWHNFNQLLLY